MCERRRSQLVAEAAQQMRAVLVRDLAFWSVMRIEGFPPGYATAHAHAALWSALLTAIVAFLWLLVRGRLVTDKTTVERFG